MGNFNVKFAVDLLNRQVDTFCSQCEYFPVNGNDKMIIELIKFCCFTEIIGGDTQKLLLDRVKKALSGMEHVPDEAQASPDAHEIRDDDNAVPVVEETAEHGSASVNDTDDDPEHGSASVNDTDDDPSPGAKETPRSDIFTGLTEKAEFAQRSKSRALLFEVHGRAAMALRLGAITPGEFMQVNRMTVYYNNTHARLSD